MNHAFSSCFVVFYDRLLCFGGVKAFLEIVLETKYIFIALGIWECSSVVGHSTAYREVGGSIPLALFFIIIGYLWKRFRRLKD